MCGRFLLISDPAVIASEFGIDAIFAPCRTGYNIAPGSDISVIVSRGTRRLTACRWGFVSLRPHQGVGPGRPVINARAETVATKLLFRDAFRKRRCLIPADGYYEWQRQGNRKKPFFIGNTAKRPFGLAGVYDAGSGRGDVCVSTCAIITTEPNDRVRFIHDRMPAIITRENYAQWLGEGNSDSDRLVSLLRPLPAEFTECYAVSPFVNNTRNDSPACICPGDQE